jgi:hypothetical protein
VPIAQRLYKEDFLKMQEELRVAEQKARIDAFAM